MLLDELADDPGMFGAHLLVREIPKEDVLLLAVVRPVGVGPDEIDGRIDEDGIDLPALPDLLSLPARDGQHLLDEPVFPHQWSDRFHGVLPSLPVSVTHLREHFVCRFAPWHHLIADGGLARR